MSEAAEQGRQVLGELGLVQRHVGDQTHGTAVLTKAMCAPGTERVRVGVLLTLADVVAGSPPTGAINPTVDLRVQLLRFPPLEAITLAGRTLKRGKQLFVAETLMTVEGDDEPFARSVATFMSWPVTAEGSTMFQRRGVLLAEQIDQRMGLRAIDRGVVELPCRPDVMNGYTGAIQGGLMSMVAEAAADSLMAGHRPWAVTDLDIRYLRPAKDGDLRGLARLVARQGDQAMIDVDLVHPARLDRVVAHVSITSHLMPEAPPY